jgi:phospholipid/cholesterol/gamma-HCH transport system substrate-binding protein
MRKTGAGIASNPVLVGGVTILVVIVAVFLSYNANKGLPFVPTTSLKVRVPNGANLVPGNEIRSGGSRVGVIEDMRPVRDHGKVVAELDLKLDKRIGDIPRDSEFRIRPRSALGLKYLELTEGNSRTAFENGDTVPAAQGSASTDIDEVLKMFDADTRKANQENLRGFGDAFAGRGQSVGRTIEELPAFLEHLQPVMSNLADPDTQLPRFIDELADAARIVAPVSEQQAALFTSMADTFEALGRDEGALKQTISDSPPTMDVAIESFRVQRPFLANLEGFGHDFAPATAELRGALPTLNRAVDVAIPVNKRAPQLNEELGKTLDQLRELAQAPGTLPGVRGLGATVTTLNPQLKFYGPFVTVCNSPNYFFTYLAEHFSEPDTTGSAQRALANTAAPQDDGVGSMGADEPANGRNAKGAQQWAQNQPYAAAITPDGRADCETGQRGWLERNAGGLDKQYRVNLNPRTPGVQGPTFTGKPRVPKGQTYTAAPETSDFLQLAPSEAEPGIR